MSSIFTYAKASSLVVELLCCDFRCKREDLSCDSRLETDLAISGFDAYELLKKMEGDLDVDMSNFDCHDRITPDHMSGSEMFWMLGFVSVPLIVAIVLNVLPPNLPLLPASLVGVSVLGILVWFSKQFRSRKHVKPEIRVRDLIRSVEARKWVSPKVDNF